MLCRSTLDAWRSSFCIFAYTTVIKSSMHTSNNFRSLVMSSTLLSFIFIICIIIFSNLWGRRFFSYKRFWPISLAILLAAQKICMLSTNLSVYFLGLQYKVFYLLWLEQNAGKISSMIIFYKNALKTIFYINFGKNAIFWCWSGSYWINNSRESCTNIE